MMGGRIGVMQRENCADDGLLACLLRLTLRLEEGEYCVLHLLGREEASTYIIVQNNTYTART